MNDMRLVLQNVLIADGSGRHPETGDIVIANDRIIAMTSAGQGAKNGDRIIRAENLIAAPGFIDVHAHSDLTLLASPDAFSKISQGVTTEISGNCGSSAFPVSFVNRDALQKKCARLELALDWSELAVYREKIENDPPAVNCGFLVGHGTLRSAVMGNRPQHATLPEIKAMQNFLEIALEQGAFGLSSGLVYVPGKFADAIELASLMEVLHKFDAVYATHMRSEGDNLLEALSEAIELAEKNAVKLEISHLKTALERNWHKLPEVFRRIEAAQTRGVKITADRYPYTCSQTSLDIILPEPYASLTDAEIQKRLASSTSDCANVHRMLEKMDRNWERVALAYTTLPEYQPLLGVSIAGICQHMGGTPAELLTDIFRRDAAHALGAFGGLSEDNMKAIIGKPYVCCGSDESALPPDGSIGRSHPRGFGSFPKFLKLAARSLGIAEAVRKVTALPAETFGIAKRGTLAVGNYADIVLLDWEKLEDRSTFTAPLTPAAGICQVWVNGRLAYTPEQGVLQHAGRFLRHHANPADQARSTS